MGLVPLGALGTTKGWGVVAFGAMAVACAAAACSEGAELAPSSTERAARITRSPALGARARVDWQERAPGRFFTRFGGASAVIDASALRLWSEPSGRQAGASLSLDGITRGRAMLSTLGSVRKSARGVELDRGVAVEHLERSRAGLEQSWEFSRAPSGEGSLVVRLNVVGMRPLASHAGGLSFDDGERQVHYSTATWVDAQGVRTPVSTRYRQGQIVLEVPANVVDASAYPAVLDPTISAAIQLHAALRREGGYVGAVDSACTASGCFYAWNQNNFVVGRRTKLDGTFVDDSVIFLGNGRDQDQIKVSAGASDYLVAWGNASDSIESPVLGVSVDATSGVVSDLPPVELVPAARDARPLASTFGNGVHWLVYLDWKTNHRRAVRVSNGQVQEPLAGTDLGTLTSYYFSIGVGPNQFAYLESDNFTRIDATTGAALDPTPIKLTKFGGGAAGGDTSIAFDGTNYIVVWGKNSKWYATRVRASDGVVLDPDDDFNELPGGRVLCTGTSGTPSASVEADRLYLTWTNPTVYTQSFPLAPWTSSSAACDMQLVFYANPSPTPKAVQVGSKGSLLLLYSDGIAAHNYQLTGSALAVSPRRTLNYNAPSLSSPSIVSNGRDFAMAGAVNQSTFGYLSLIDGATGEVKQLSTQDVTGVGGVVASGGSDYLFIEAVWDGSRRARKLSCDGTMGLPKALPSYSTIAGLVGDGARYFALYTNGGSVYWGQRLDSDGAPLEEAKFMSNEWTLATVAADTAPTPDKRTFVILGRAQSKALAVRVRSETGSVLAPITLTSEATLGGYARASAASDGTRTFLTWDKWIDNETPNESWGTVLDPATGTFSAPKKLDASLTGVTFDGMSLMGWSSSWGVGNVKRYDAQLAPVDANPAVSFEEYEPSFASNRYGRSMIAARRYSIKDLGDVYFGRFVDNELATEDPDSAPVSCVIDGAGGAGGAGGEPSGGTSTGGTTSGGTTSGGTTSGESGEGGVAGEVSVGGAPTEAGGPGVAGSANAGSGGTVTAGGSSPTAGGSSPTAGGSSPTAGGAEASGGSAVAGSAGTSTSGAGGSSPDGSGAQGGEPAAAPEGGSKDSSGCSCRTTATTTQAAPWPLLLGVLALAGRRRKPRTANAEG